MSDTEWRSGPPPSIGWWPTKVLLPDSIERIRWWNGARWSVPASQLDAELGRLDAASSCQVLDGNEHILWRPRPANWLPRSFT